MTAVLLTSLGLLLAGGTAQSEETLRDAAVYEAVLRHTVLPQSQKFNAEAHNRTVSRVMVADLTIGFCGAEPDAVQKRLGCLSNDSLQYFAEGLPRGRGHIFKELPESVRAELASSVRARNGANHPFAAKALSLVDAVSPAALPTVPFEGRPARDYAVFSRPGYSADGRALVYASYVCGSLCGYGWLFLLEERAGSWQVADVFMLWIA